MDCCPGRTTVHFRASYKSIVVNNDAPFTHHHDGTNVRNFLRRFRTRPRTNRRDGFVHYQGRREALDSGQELGHVSASPVVQASGQSLVFHRGSQDMGRGTVLQPLHELRRRLLKWLRDQQSVICNRPATFEQFIATGMATPNTSFRFWRSITAGFARSNG